jgi:hypothetical protein
MRAGILKWTILILLLVASCPAFSLDVRFFPGTSVSELPHGALGRQAGMDFDCIYSVTAGKALMQFGAGGKLTGLRIRFGDDAVLGFGGFGWMYSLFDLFSESFDYLYSDYLLGGFVDFRFGKWLSESSIYHTSHHLGDDALTTGGLTYLNMGIEAIKQYVDYDLFSFLTLSLGIEYKIGKRPENLVFYNTSFLAGFRLDTLDLSLPFFLDTEAEFFSTAYAPNFGFRLGMYANFCNLIGSASGERCRHFHELFIGYYIGLSKKIYFYTSPEHHIYLGAGFRL